MTSANAKSLVPSLGAHGLAVRSMMTISTGRLFTILAVPSDICLPLQNSCHAESGDACVRVLPESEHRPSGDPQLEVRIPVSALICLNLRTPPIRVGLWPRSVLGTAMPETPIDEHRNLRSHEGNIRAAARARQCHIDPITQAESTQGRAQGDLAGCVAAASGLHPAPNFG
jgi:hypothetical protein